tara:strand:+ start:149 stop:460 length:312 start_codon:yes stop_codon:yes gene_type:complete
MDVTESTEFSPVAVHLPPTSDSRLVEEDNQDFLDCCKKTIVQHAAHNPMMVCPDCKQIIKCFDNAKAFQNYRRFCASRHRRILATVFEEWHVIVFKSYETYST